MARIRSRITHKRLPLAPVAGFSAPVLAGTAPVTLNLVDESQHGTSWEYICTGNLGGVITSNQRNPSINFTTGEFWTIRQIVRNRTGEAEMTRTAYITTTAAPEIEIRGNGILINNGDMTPSVADGTDYGNALQGSGGVTQTFRVNNLGSLPLIRTAPTTIPAGFTLVQDIPASIPVGEFRDLIIRLNDSPLGYRVGNVTIHTDDFNEAVTTFRIQGEAVPATPASPGDPPAGYSVVTTVRAQPGMSPGDWVTPIGIAPDLGAGAIPAAKFNNIWARSQSGGWSYVQIEQVRTWAVDGSLKLATGHFQIPTGYVDGQKIEICVGTGDGPPNLPNWSTVTSAFTANVELEVERYEPKIYLLATTGTAAVGDVIRISITDSLGTQTYQRTVRANRPVALVMRDLCVEMSLDPAGRYRGMKDPMARILPPPPDMAADPETSDYSIFVGVSFNSAVGQIEGVNFGNYGAEYRPPLILSGWPSAPVNEAGGAGRLYPNIAGSARFGWGDGFYLWPRWKAGNPEDYGVIVEVIRAGGSTLAFRNSLLGVTSTTNGEPIVMQQRVNRTTHLLTWAAAAETPRSPYFNGRIIRQNERKIDLPGTSVTFRMCVSWASTGLIADAYIQAENSKMYSGGADAYYDVTAIRINGVNQLNTPELLEDHRDLHHYLWKKWRWHRPKKFAMCDPSAYMRTDLHGSFKTFPTDDNRDTLQIFSRGAPPCAQGSNSNGGDLYKINPVQLAARGGFQQARLNRPLWSGPIAFDGAGGARPGIALYDLLGTVFLTSDCLSHWDDLLAIADNGFSNFPWYVRDERGVNAGAIDNPDTVDADQADAPPHIYKHIANSLGNCYNYSFGRAKPMLLGVAKQAWTFTYSVARQFTPNYKVFSLYHGYSGGSYGWYEFPTPSHHPPHSAKVVYMVRPEACFLDSLEQYAWAVYSIFCGPAVPRVGGQVFDANHRASWATVNGNRGFSWPWRDCAHAASMMWDSHVRKPLWTRVVSDGGDYFRRNAQNTWGGVFHAQAAANSDNWTTAHTLQKPGSVDRSWDTDNDFRFTIDLFKSAYVTQVATFVHQAGLADLSDALSLGMYWHRAFDDPPINGKAWFWMYGVWNNAATPTASVLIKLAVASSAGFSPGQIVTVSGSGLAGTVFAVAPGVIEVSPLSVRVAAPAVGQTVTNGSATTTLINAGGNRPYLMNNVGLHMFSRDGMIASDSIPDIIAYTDDSPWLYGENYRYTSAPVGDEPFGFGSSSGYYNEMFHWKALYGQSRFGTNATERAKAQTWINFLNARHDPGALRTVGQISLSYPYVHPNYRLRYAMGVQHCWVAPAEIAGQAW